MSPLRAVARLMAMDDATWSRHANPWSGWTRAATTPVLFLALWSHVWLGWWALVPIAALAVWLWLNPRLFPPPSTTTNWATRGVLGEQLWLAGDPRAHAPRHAGPVRWIVGGQAAFTAVGIYGLIVEDFWAAFLGWHAGAAMKLWFVDRMARLYDEAGENEKKATT